MNVEPSSWRALLGPAHLGPVTVLAGGVLVGAVSIYLAASLLPSAVAELGGHSFYAWNMTVYLVAMVATTMLSGRVLAAWGAPAAYLAGFGTFLAGSLACAASPAMALLLGGRAVQGLGAGLLSGLGFAVIRSALPASLWARGSALMSAMYGVGNFAGPALGGLFAQFGSWRGAFVLLAVLAAAGAEVAVRVLPRAGAVVAADGGTGAATQERRKGAAPGETPVLSLLLVASATAAVSLASVVTATAARAAGVAAALALMAAFVVHERRSPRRVFPAATYRRGSPLAWIYLTLGLLAFGVALESFLPLYGQRLAGLAPLAAGFLAAAISLGWSLTQIASSSASSPRAVRRLLVLGPVLLAAGLAVTALLVREPTPLALLPGWVVALLVAGAGVGLAYPHLSVAAMSSTADPDEGRRAAAGVATVTTLSTAFGTAAGGLLINLGGPSPDTAARTLLLGFAALCALGVLTARRSTAPRPPVAAESG
ncbi:MFS transporter [Nonomuraea longicatena]|uniref:MFS transporter n=1 Tax=Nonomuraea longicatena TaxID=83682 RepID=A0ABN1R416_9ACTN